MYKPSLLVALALQTTLFATQEPVLFTNPPPNFSLKAEVAGVIPIVRGKILLLQRVSTHPQANLWCAPGGKMEPNETPSQAAVRELREETGIEVDSTSLIYLGKFFVRYPNGDFIFYLFQTFLENNWENIKLSNEHQAYGFFSPSELNSLPLTPGLEEGIQLLHQKQEAFGSVFIPK